MRGNGKLVHTYVFFLALSYDLQSHYIVLFQIVSELGKTAIVLNFTPTVCV